MTINEFKESPTYLLSVWFKSKEKTVKNWFENKELGDLEFEYFEFNTSSITPMYYGYLFFHEKDIEYKLQIGIDTDSILDGIVDDIIVTLFAYEMDSSEDEVEIGSISNTITDGEFIPDFLLQQITDLKTEFITK